jgi:hypothetical protein
MTGISCFFSQTLFEPRLVVARLMLAGLVLLAAPDAAAAQARPGDLLIAHQSGPPYNSSILALTPGATQVSTVATFQPTSLRGVMVGANNTHYYACARTVVYEVTPTGAITTLQPLIPVGSFGAWIELDEDGQLLVGSGFAGQGGLMRMDPRTGAVTATLMQNAFPLSFCLDRDTGEIVVADGGTGQLVRIRRDGSITTVGQVNQYPYSMDFHLPTGDCLIGSMSAIYRLSRWNSLTTFTAVPWSMKALAVFGDGTVAAGGNNVPAMLHYDARGGLIGTLLTATMSNVCMAVEDEHNLWGLNAPSVGGLLNLSVRFAAHPRKPYVVAASFSPRPGIPVAGRVIPLYPDDLFRATFALPQVFVHFVGLLDAQGRASPYVLVPKHMSLQGLRFFFAAVVIDSAAPGGIAAVSQEYGVTVQ